MGILSTENNLKIHHVLIAIFLVIGLSLLLYYPSINYYFLQDDWFVLNWVRSNNLLSFFEFRTDIIYWRPLSMPLFFWIGKILFGLNPFGFHVISFILHFLNILLLSTISYLLFKNIKAALLSGFLFATASFHFMTLSWLSLTWNVIGLFFFQIAIVFYLQYRNKISYIKYYGIIIFSIILIIRETGTSHEPMQSGYARNLTRCRAHAPLATAPQPRSHGNMMTPGDTPATPSPQTKFG